ncbi:MAG: helix-turn-helix domain-containing protein [Hyphomicrobiales bacterium]
MLRFNTNALEPRDRFEIWADIVNTNYTPLQLTPAGEQAFYGEISIETVAGFEIVLAGGVGHRTQRTQADIAKSPKQFYMAMVHVAGDTGFISPAGRTDLRRGDVLLVDTMHELGFDNEHPYQSLQVKFSKEWVDARIARPEPCVGSVLPHDHPLARLFAGYLACGFQVADKLAPSASAMFGQHLLDILAEAFTSPEPDAPRPPAMLRATVYARACRMIALRFGESSLTPDLIAHDLGISTRTLHRIFAEHAETVMQRVFAERIDRAAKLLASPSARHQTITEIAFACGFNDLTHFGRLFAERMGMLPSQWRKQAL